MFYSVRKTVLSKKIIVIEDDMLFVQKAVVKNENEKLVILTTWIKQKHP